MRAEPAYDYSKSTQENFRLADGSTRTWGPYKKIRDSLDKQYHGGYTRQRQAVQDELIAGVIGPHQAQQETPWIVFTAGAMGAGKSRTIHWLAAKGIFPLHDIVNIDSDVFKTAFPEWPGYVARDPLTAGSQTRRESGYLVEIAQEAALLLRKHIWVDGSMRDGDWYERVFRDIRKRHPDYRIAILYVMADEGVIRERVRKRGLETGRLVPPEELLDSIKRVPQTVDRLDALTDFIAHIDNSGSEPVLRRYKDEMMCVIEQSCWDEITERLRNRPLDPREVAKRGAEKHGGRHRGAPLLRLLLQNRRAQSQDSGI